jgi:hypothetical protein
MGGCQRKRVSVEDRDPIKTIGHRSRRSEAAHAGADDDRVRPDGGRRHLSLLVAPVSVYDLRALVIQAASATLMTSPQGASW